MALEASRRLPPSAEDHAAFFDVEAERYDAAYDEGSPEGHVLRARLVAALDLLGAEGGEVLDAGMGPGRLCVELDARGFRVSGVDASPEMVARARHRLPGASECLLCSSIERLPFDEGSFDAVVATGVLEYAGDRAAAVRELARVLRPDGLAVMSIPNIQSPYILWRRSVFYPLVRLVKRFAPLGRRAPVRRRRPPSARRFRQMLASAGLELEARAYAGCLVLPAPLDELFPGATVAIARRIEHSAPGLSPLLAAQLVFAARKPPGSQTR